MSEFAMEFGASGEQPEAPQQPQERQTTSLTLSADEFAALEERVLRAVEMVKRERAARLTAEERATQAEEQLRQSAQRAEQLQKEIDAMRGERGQVRDRVEHMLAQLETLEG